MAAYIARRLLLMIPTLFGIMVVNFAIVQLAPGGPVELGYRQQGFGFHYDLDSRAPRTSTTFADFLAVQNGSEMLPSLTFENTLRYMRSGRGLGEWVHVDVLFQAYFMAFLVLPVLQVQEPTKLHYMHILIVLLLQHT